MDEQLEIICYVCSGIKNKNEVGYRLNLHDEEFKHSATVWVHGSCSLERAVLKLVDFLYGKKNDATV